MQEKIVETKKCKNCGIDFDITKSDLDFYDKISPVFNDKKYQIPTPDFCPDCRQQRRESFRNERYLYKRKSDFSGDNIISVFSPKSPYTVYTQDEWRSDNWDPLDYGFDFDINEMFFSQIGKLYKTIPHMSMINVLAENSKYCHQTDNMKDCYLVFGSKSCDSCYYSYRTISSDNVFDSSHVNKSSCIYNCIEVNSCYNLFNSRDCENCSNSWYLQHCNSCSDCFACVNLNNKQYCIENKQYTKQDYLDKISTIKELYSLATFDQFKSQFPVEDTITINCENVSGNYIYRSKNIKNGFFVYDSENITYGYTLYGHVHNSFDVFSAHGPIDKCYECSSFGIGAYNCLFVTNCHPISNSMYCFHCFDSSYLFGCVGLRNKEYCILNKQYTKQEYEILVPKIIKHMQSTGERGENFPTTMSLFGYNQSPAYDNFPLSREEVISKGRNWYNEEENDTKSLPLPQGVVKCKITGKVFRLMDKELNFYIKHNLELPTKHPDIRYKERGDKISRKLHNRSCAKCNIKMKTTYSPDRPEIVYCNTCFNKEIYG